MGTEVTATRLAPGGEGGRAGCCPSLTRPPTQVEDSYPGQGLWLRDYCASGLYVLTLLLDGFGFSQETWVSIKFRTQVTHAPMHSQAQAGAPHVAPQS